MVLLDEMPVGADVLPAVVPEATESTLPVAVQSNSLISTPEPTPHAMKAVTVLVLLPHVPVGSDFDSLGASPAPQNPVAIQMATDSLEATPEPAASLVVVVLPPQMPVSTDLAPVAIVVALQCTQEVAMQFNAPEMTLDQTRAAVRFVVVMVRADEFPVWQSFVETETIQIAINPAVSSPEPCVWPVVVVPLSEVPVGA
jgi:hypothetical protein